MTRWAQHALVDSLVREGVDEQSIVAAVTEVQAQAATAPRVLVAEDEPITRLELAGLLTSAGFDVCAEAADGRQAIALIERHTPDVVVMDANMPQLDGVSAAHEILLQFDIPIVIVTGYRYGELVDRALNAGVSGYIVKPFHEQDVVDAVRAALRGETSAPVPAQRRLAR